MFEFKEPFVYGFDVTHNSMYSHIENIPMVVIKMGFFMMERPDNHRIIFQDTLGSYNETTEKHIIRLNDEVLDILEAGIVERYEYLKKIKQAEKDAILHNIDKLIDKKSLYLRERQDILKKETPETPLTDSQKRAYKNLGKALKRVDKQLRKQENDVFQVDRYFDGLDAGMTASVELMTKNIKLIKE